MASHDISDTAAAATAAAGQQNRNMLENIINMSVSIYILCGIIVPRIIVCFFIGLMPVSASYSGAQPISCGEITLAVLFLLKNSVGFRTGIGRCGAPPWREHHIVLSGMG